MAGDWRISADERLKYDSYFQQCGPNQGYLSGEQARDFFFKSNLPGDILRKIWDLADITADGRLDKREFAIACYLISSQVQKKGPLPPTLPPSLLSDASITSNGLPTVTNVPSQPIISCPNASLLTRVSAPANISVPPLTPQARSKYLQQFHGIVDVNKSNGFMSGLQAKNVLQQTGLSHVALHQIWNLADYDKDGRLTPDEFVIAMHCCDLARAGHALPVAVPEEWISGSKQQRERIDSASKPPGTSTFATLNQQLKETFNVTQPTNETSEQEQEQKAAKATYEEKRLKNYEDGNKELERRRQLLREQEEREQREREERERKRELELQKQKEEQERKKQMEIERQLEKQRQIEQQKEEERRKLFEQREAARKELERKNRLEWERQRMQELSTQKSRLLEQINDLKSREKAMELEVQSMDENRQTCLAKIDQTNTIVHTMDESIADIQRKIDAERSEFDTIEKQRKDLMLQSSNLQTERESLEISANELQQSKEFSAGNRELDQMKTFDTQIENLKQEGTQLDAQITTVTEQCKEYQTQMEQLHLQLAELEQTAKEKKPPSPVLSSVTTPSANFANFDQFNSNTSANESEKATFTASFSAPVVPTPSSPIYTEDIDPFQAVDPFASHSNVVSTATHNNWFPATHQGSNVDTADPFLPKMEPTGNSATVVSPKPKRMAPKPTPNLKEPSKPAVTVDPWGGTSTSNNSHDWAQFHTKENESPFGTTGEWPQTKPNSNEVLSNNPVQYRVLYDYVPEREDEMAISTDEIITVDPSKQQDQQWLFGQVGNEKQGFFPVAYTELITTTPLTTTSTSLPADGQPIDKTSPLAPGSYAFTLADYQGKTTDKHLSFKKGEIILVRDQKDATWYAGQLHGKIGWFPRNHVRPATETEIQNTKNSNSNKNTPTDEKLFTSSVATNGNKADVYEAIYAYEATDPSDLSFDVGEHILVLTKEGDWWTGQIGDRTGTFPYNYVQQIGQNGQISTNGIQMPTGGTPTEPTKSTLPRYIAIFPYDAQQEDELSFPADAVLEILDQSSTSGWFKARLNDQTGLIPSTYVHPLDTPNQ